MNKLGSALVQAVVISSILTGGAVLVVALQTRANQNFTRIQNRTIDRTTAEAATEHGVAIIKTAMDAGVPLETLAELTPNETLNTRPYAIDMTLAAFGDVRAGVTNANQDNVTARFNPNTGEINRGGSTNANIDPLTLANEWRDVHIHDIHTSPPNDLAPTKDSIIIAAHQRDIFTIHTSKPTEIPTTVRFPNRNTPITQLDSFTETTTPIRQIGVALDRNGQLWLWDLQEAQPTAHQAVQANGNPLPSISLIATTKTAVIAHDRNNNWWVYGRQQNHPIIPDGTTGTETLHDKLGNNYVLHPRTLQLPDDTTLPTITHLTAGDNHVILTDELNNMYGWGDNTNQQLGNNPQPLLTNGTNPCTGTTCNLARINHNTNPRGRQNRITHTIAFGDVTAIMDDRNNVILLGHTSVNPHEVDTVSIDASGRPRSFALTGDSVILRLNNGVLIDYPGDPGDANVIMANFTPRDGFTSAIRNPDLIRASRNVTAVITAGRLFVWANPESYADAVQATNIASPRDRTTGSAGAITNVTIAPGDANLTLTWESSENDTEFIISTGVNGEDGVEWTPHLTTSAQTALITDLVNGTPYFVTIALPGEAATWTGGPNAPRAAPDAIDITKVTQTPEFGGITITWDPPNNNGAPITQYRIEENSIDNLTWEIIPTPTLSNRLQLRSIKPTTTLLRITAINAAGESTPTIVDITNDRPPEPVAIENISGHETGSEKSGITVHWRHPNPSNVSRYEVEYSSDNVNWLAAGSVSGGNNHNHRFTIENLELGITYAVRITAINGSGSSNARIATTTVTNGKKAPTILTGAFQAATPNSITLTWTWGTNPTNERFIIQRNDNPTPETVTGYAFTDSNVQPGRTYRYSVAHATNRGPGQFSDPIEISTGTTAPDWGPNTTQVQTLNITPTGVTIRWNAPAFDGGTEVWYNVRIAPETTPDATVLNETTKNISLIVDNASLTQDTGYIITVTPGHRNPDTAATISNAGAPITTRFRTPPKNLDTTWSVTAENSGPGIVTIRWAIPKVTGTNETVSMRSVTLYRNDTESPLATITDGTNSFVDRTATVGNEVTYWLKGTSGSGAEVASDVTVSFRVLRTPNPPTNIKVTPVVGDDGVATFQFTWDEPTNKGGATDVSYLIDRIDSNTSEVTLASGDTIDGLGLAIGKEYKFRVATSNGRFRSGWVETEPITLMVRPSPPQDLKGRHKDGNVILTWSTPNFTVGTNITFSVNNTNVGSVYAWSETVTNTDTSVTRTYEVRTHIGDQVSDPATIDVDIPPQGRAPTAPNVTYSSGASGGTPGIRVSWAAVSGTKVTYGLFMATGNNSAGCNETSVRSIGADLAVTNLTVPPTSFTVAPNAETYACFAVTHTVGGVTSPRSPFSAPILMLGAPPAPTDSTGQALFSVSGPTNATLTGTLPVATAANRITQVIIERAEAGSNPIFSRLTALTANQNWTWTDPKTLTAGETVLYRIRYANELFVSSPSAHKSFTANAISRNISATATIDREEKTITVSWNADQPDAFTNYSINFTSINSLTTITRQVNAIPGTATSHEIELGTVSPYWGWGITITGHSSVISQPGVTKQVTVPFVPYPGVTYPPTSNNATSISPTVTWSTTDSDLPLRFVITQPRLPSNVSIDENTGVITVDRTGSRHPNCITVNVTDPVIESNIIASIRVPLNSGECSPLTLP